MIIFVLKYFISQRYYILLISKSFEISQSITRNVFSAHVNQDQNTFITILKPITAIRQHTTAVTSLTLVILNQEHRQKIIFLVWYCFKLKAWQLHQKICTPTTKGLLEPSVRLWLTDFSHEAEELLSLGLCLPCPSFSHCGAKQSDPVGYNKINSEI